MKRRWMTSVFTCLSFLAACQVDPRVEPDPSASTAETAQAVSQYCGAQLPPTPFWDGTPLGPTGPGQLYLIYEDLTKPGEWVAMLADYGQGKLVRGVRTKSSGLVALYSTMDLATQYAGGRQPNPPGPIGTGAIGAALLEWARLAAGDRAAAEKAASTCP